MSEMKKIVIMGDVIIENEILDISTTLTDNRYFLLTGIVYTPDLLPLPNVAIQVFLIDESTVPSNQKLVGVTFSGEEGIYGICLLGNRKYLLIAYS